MRTILRAVSAALMAAGTAWAADTVEVPLFTPGTNAMPPPLRPADDGPGAGGWVVVEDGTSAGARVLAQLGGAPGRTRLAVLEGRPAATLQASVRLNLVGGTAERAAGLALRVTDADTYYAAAADVRRRKVGLSRIQGGVATLLGEAAAPLETGRWYRLGFAADGARLSVSLDGTELLAVADRALAAGRVALMTRGDSIAVFDSLLITPPD